MLAPLENHSEISEREELGPAMRALNLRRRAFVNAMFSVAPGRGAPIRAAIAAGYGTAKSSRASLRVIAYRLVNDPQIQDALQEVGKARFHELFPVALSALEKLLKDKNHKSHGHAVMGVIERLCPAEFLHKHEHDHRHRITDTAGMVERIKEFAVKLGLPTQQLLGPNNAVVAEHAKSGATIEATAIEIPNEPTGGDLA
jgi:phage terminase small subunit